MIFPPGEKAAVGNAGQARYSSLAWLRAVGSGKTDPEAKPLFPLAPPSVPPLHARRPPSNKLHLPRGAVKQNCSLRPFNLLAAGNEL